MTDAKQPLAIDKSVGAKIREARREAGFTQSQLASELGRTFQQLQKYEKGVNRISAGVLFEISKTLRKDLTWFFGDADFLEAIEFQPDDCLEFKQCVEVLLRLRNSENLSSVLSLLKLVVSAEPALKNQKAA
jgi:transcriptional regulator with XRE-family HTH domain